MQSTLLKQADWPCLDIEEQPRQVQEMKKLLALLPKQHYRLIQHLMEHLLR
jgi:hypothetical protein